MAAVLSDGWQDLRDRLAGRLEPFGTPESELPSPIGPTKTSETFALTTICTGGYKRIRDVGAGLLDRAGALRTAVGLGNTRAHEQLE